MHQSPTKPIEEFAAQKVEVYLRKWYQTRRQRGASAVKLGPLGPLETDYIWENLLIMMTKGIGILGSTNWLEPW